MIKYDNILEQFIFAYQPDDAPPGLCKDEALDKINHAIGTNYKRTHLNNWLAGRTGTPRRVAIYCGDTIMAIEFSTAGLTIGRAFK